MAEGDQATVAASPGGSAAAAGEAPAPPVQDTDSGDPPLSPMELQLEMVSSERDDYRRKFETVEAELAALTAASPNADTINKLQQDNDHLRKTLKKATDMLREKITSCNMQEKKNQALTQQVATLKEVLQVTRDLLNIRNMEVEQLQKNVDSMEARIDDNRRRQTTMIKQMEQATKINGELRNEYETQLRLFQSLKERYEEKVTKLTSLAYERQRHNSEGSDNFEDAADTADKTEAATTTEGNAAEATNTTESNVAEAAAVTEGNAAEAANTTELGSALDTSGTAETSNISEPTKAMENIASETNSPGLETNTPEVTTTDITKNSQNVMLETARTPEIVTTEVANTPEIPEPGKMDAQETSAPKTSALQ